MAYELTAAPRSRSDLVEPIRRQVPAAYLLVHPDCSDKVGVTLTNCNNGDSVVTALVGTGFLPTVLQSLFHHQDANAAFDHAILRVLGDLDASLKDGRIVIVGQNSYSLLALSKNAGREPLLTQ